MLERYWVLRNMSKIKVVADTNIFINSWFSSNHFYCDAVIDLIDNKKIELVFSQDTIGELFYVVKNFVYHAFNDKQIQFEYMHMLSEIFFESSSVNTSKTECPKIKDSSDEMFLKTAIESNADYIVSDDKESGMHIVKLDSIKIVNSKQFVSMYERLCV